MNKTSYQDWPSYQLIKAYYQNKRAERSQVLLINHIHEGLKILDLIAASEIAKKAYCLHPIFQADEALKRNYKMDWANIAPNVLICTMEYRSTANAYLSKKQIETVDEIVLSPLKEVNDMLIADKIQNRKDFELYHKDTHPRSQELAQYFENWLTRLGVSTAQYEEYKRAIS